MNNKNLKVSLTALALRQHGKGIHDATARATHGHFPETAATPAAAHPHKE